jgi:hypothetical protein
MTTTARTVKQYFVSSAKEYAELDAKLNEHPNVDVLHLITLTSDAAPSPEYIFNARTTKDGRRVLGFANLEQLKQTYGAKE